MKISDEYKQILDIHLSEIRKSGRPVIIFGTGRAGWYTMKVLEHYNVPIAAFSASDPGAQDTGLSYPVLAPADVATKFPGACVFLGLFMPDTAAAVGKQFQELNLESVHFDTPAFLFTFFVEVVKRACDKEILAKSIYILFENYKEGNIHYRYTRDKYFVSPFVTSVITQKCSLRCRDCAQLIPYYKAPVNFSAESVISDLKQYAKAFDVVPEISLHGGEPFLHPDVAKICTEAAAISNIVFISFVTNGTIMPGEQTLRALSQCGADVHQSGGYGALSRKQGELFEVFGRHGIYSDIMYCSPTEMWTKAPPYKKHFRPDVLNNELYGKCVSSKVCCQIMNGELHRCALSMHGAHQSVFPKNENDFVRLHDANMSNGDLSGRIRDFLTRDSAISVCDWCDPDGGTPVPPAVQLPANHGKTGPALEGKEAQ